MTKRLASLVFFLVVTTFDLNLVAGETSISSNSANSTAAKNFALKNRSNECQDCIRRVRTYFSKTVQSPRQFCIENELCPKTKEPSSQPTEIPSLSPSKKPSSKPSLRPSSLPSEGPSLLPSSVPTAEPSEIPSDGPSLLPSNVPTFQPSEVPTDWPSLVSSEIPSSSFTNAPSASPSDVSSNKLSMTFGEFSFSNEVPDDTPMDPSVSSRLDDTEPDSIPIMTNQPTVTTPSVTPPTVLSGSVMRSPASIFGTDFSRGGLSSQPGSRESLSSEMPSLESIPTATSSWRTTVSSLFLKNIDGPMNPEITQIFSSTVLQFLRDYSSSIDIEGAINFFDVKVVGQGAEFGNSTESDTHIDGMHIYFETISDVEGNRDVDLPWVIEKIFKINKNEFLYRLSESNEFFTPIGVDGRNSRETVSGQERERVSTNAFMNSWVISSLAVVLCSVLITTMLMTRMVQGATDGPSIYCGQKPKSGMYPLSALEQTSSDDSDFMVKPKNRKRSDDISLDIERDDSLDILLNMDDDSLAGLKLLHNEDASSLAYSKQSIVRKKKNECKENGSKLDIDSHQRGNMKENEVSKQTGKYARLRKPEIEQQIKRRVSDKNEGTSLEAILMATSSFNSEEDGDHSGRMDGVEVCAGDFERDFENVSLKKSLMQRVMNLFQGKKNCAPPRLKPVRIMEDGDSLLSYPTTPARSVDKRIEYIDLSINTDMMGEQGDKTRTSAFSPIVFSPQALAVDTALPTKDLPDRIETTSLPSPISKRLLAPKAKEDGETQVPKSNNRKFEV